MVKNNIGNLVLSLGLDRKLKVKKAKIKISTQVMQKFDIAISVPNILFFGVKLINGKNMVLFLK
jgi:hypothetical protein